MTRAQIWLQHISSLLVAGTGLVYLVMKHLMAADDPFAVVNHPAQPLVQHLHVLSAPVLTFVMGFFWAFHVAPNARRTGTPGWGSGIVLLVGFVPMLASGYLLQVSTEPAWRTAWMWIHLVTGVLWALGYAAHLARPALAALRKGREDGVGGQAARRAC